MLFPSTILSSAIKASPGTCSNDKYSGWARSLTLTTRRPAVSHRPLGFLYTTMPKKDLLLSHLQLCEWIRVCLISSWSIIEISRTVSGVATYSFSRLRMPNPQRMTSHTSLCHAFTRACVALLQQIYTGIHRDPLGDLRTSENDQSTDAGCGLGLFAGD